MHTYIDMPVGRRNISADDRSQIFGRRQVCSHGIPDSDMLLLPPAALEMIQYQLSLLI